MHLTNIHNAKSHLSKYLKVVAGGEEVVICSYGNPIAKLVPYSDKHENRVPGVCKGNIKIGAEFDKLPVSFMKHFK